MLDVKERQRMIDIIKSKVHTWSDEVIEEIYYSSPEPQELKKLLNNEATEG